MTGEIGAEIVGVDLSEPLSAELVAAIRAAWLRWRVVFFRDQQLTPAQHIAFAGRFGKVTPAHISRIKLSDEYPEILPLDSTVKELLDDARTRAILTTHVPLIVEHAPEYPDIYPMTFRALAAMTEAQTMAGLTPDVLKKIEAEIARPATEAK